uniref:Uncharacterized protein n=1 Tax=Salarias fasciatus TaxID=181472 RepID=A0A672FZD4_SALFA
MAALDVHTAARRLAAVDPSGFPWRRFRVCQQGGCSGTTVCRPDVTLSLGTCVKLAFEGLRVFGVINVHLKRPPVH